MMILGGLKSRGQRRAAKNNDAGETVDTTIPRRRSSTVRRPTRMTVGGRKPQQNPPETEVVKSEIQITKVAPTGEHSQLIEEIAPDVLVTRLHNVYDTNPVSVPFKEILNDQAHNETIKQLVDEIQKAPTTAVRNKFKKKLPVYILAELEAKRDRNGKRITGVSQKFFK